MTQRHGNPNSIPRLIARELRSGNRMKDAPDRPALSPPAEGEVSHPTGNAVQDALIAGFLHGVGRTAWDDMHDYIAVCAVDYGKGKPLPERSFEPDDINWKSEWEAVCSLRINLANAARPFADLAEEFSACGDGQPIGIKAVSGKSDLNVGDLRCLSDALAKATPTPTPSPVDWNVVGPKLVEALGEIVDLCPATCETSDAHTMAEVARESLANQRPPVDLNAVAKVAAERAGKNASVAPQLLFAHILWAMQDAFPGLVAAQKGAK